jgi:hypothetical protein
MIGYTKLMSLISEKDLLDNYGKLLEHQTQRFRKRRKRSVQAMVTPLIEGDKAL